MPSRFELVEELPLNANGKPDRGRARAVLQTPSSDHGDPTARVLDIYLRTLAPPSMPELTAESPLVSLGLRPSHLPGIAQALNTSFGTQVTAANLIRCQTARQVVDLLAAA